MTCLRRCTDWLAKRNCLAVASFSLIAFALLAVFSACNAFGPAHHLDREVIFALRAPEGRSMPLGGFGVERLFLELTGFGDHAVLIVLIGAVCGYLALSKRGALAIVLILAIISGALLIKILKLSFVRSADDIVNYHTYHVAEVWADSFPSGHATIAAMAYLTLGCLLASVQRTRRLKIFVTGLALTLTVIVGLSRIYLGIHYPTDVFAGWAIGGMWALIWVAAAYKMEEALP